MFKILTTLLIASLATAQDTTPPKTSAVQRVLVLFDGADADDDRQVSPREALKAGIRGADFAAHDHDGDRAWDPDEFLVYYRQLLDRAGHTVDPKLDEAVEKVLEARRKAAERARAARQEAARAARAAAEQETPSTEPETADAQPTGTPEAGGDATPSEGVGNTANAAPVTTIDPAQGAEGEQDAQGASPTQEKLDQAKRELQQRAANAEGNVTREQFEAAADKLDERAAAASGQGEEPGQGEEQATEAGREAAIPPAATPATAATATGGETAATSQEKLDQAKRELQQRAANAEGNVTREQFEAAAAKLDERAAAAGQPQGTAGTQGSEKASTPATPEPVVVNARERGGARKVEGLKPAATGAGGQKASDTRERERQYLRDLASGGSLETTDVQLIEQLLDPARDGSSIDKAQLRGVVSRIQSRLQSASSGTGSLSGQEARALHARIVERAQALLATGTQPQASNQGERAATRQDEKKAEETRKLKERLSSPQPAQKAPAARKTPADPKARDRSEPKPVDRQPARVEQPARGPKGAEGKPAAGTRKAQDGAPRQAGGATTQRKGGGKARKQGGGRG